MAERSNRHHHRPSQPIESFYAVRKRRTPNEKAQSQPKNVTFETPQSSRIEGPSIQDPPIGDPPIESSSIEDPPIEVPPIEDPSTETLETFEIETSSLIPAPPTCTREEAGSLLWDAESAGAESPDHLQEDYSKDPDYNEQESEEMQLSEEEYGEDSEEGASEADSSGSGDEEWLNGGRKVKTRTQLRSAERPSSQHAFNNGVGAELVPWLKKNFRLSYNPAAIMPRSQLYNKYERFCAKNNMTVVNSACLGKVLRRTFPGVDTRRLGRRGESKYHYIGLEINPKKYQEDSTEVATDKLMDAKTITVQFSGQEKKRPKRLSYPVTRTLSRNPLLRIWSQLNMENRENLYMQVFGKLLRSAGFGHSTFVPEYLKRSSEWKIKLPILETDIEIGTSIRREQVDTYIHSFRIHLGIVSHCVASGAFVTLPEVFGNFWISRNESLQVPVNLSAARGVSDVLIMYDLVGCENFQKFTADSYLDTYNRLAEHFTPNFETTVGTAFIQIINEFITRYPSWILQVVSGLHRGMVDVLHCSALAFCVLLRKRIYLFSAFSLVQPIQTDQLKTNFILKIFREIQTIWNKGMLKDVTEDESESARQFVSKTFDILNDSSGQCLTRWRCWINERLQFCSSEKESKNEIFFENGRKTETQRHLRSFLYITITTCNRLRSLAQTEINATECFQTIEPFLWLLNFFQRYISFIVEIELVKLEPNTAIKIIFQNAIEEGKLEPKNRKIQEFEKNQEISVVLDILNTNLGDCFRTAMPSKSNFYAGSEDLEPFVAILDDRKVPEMAPPVSAAEVASTTRKEPSLLELLLR